MSKKEELKITWGVDESGEVVAVPGHPVRPAHIRITTIEGTDLDEVIVWPSEVTGLIEALQKAVLHLNAEVGDELEKG